MSKLLYKFHFMFVLNLSKAYEFLKECGSFFVLTINGDYLAGRPFGAVMEVGED